MMVLVRGCIAALIILAIMFVCGLMGFVTVLDNLAGAKQAQAQIAVAKEQTTQTEILASAQVKVTELQENGNTERTRIVTNGSYRTSWVSVAHRLLNWTVILGVAVWTLVGLSLASKNKKGTTNV